MTQQSSVVECARCQRTFTASAQAGRAQCPHCGTWNEWDPTADTSGNNLGQRRRANPLAFAQELQLRNSDQWVKVQSPWAAALLPIITLGIYHLVWWYRINRELRDYGAARGYDLGQSPLSSLLALFPGGLVVVPALVTYWRGTKRVQGAALVAGTAPLSGWIAFILYFLLSPVLWAYIQASLNGVWRLEAADQA